MRFILYLFTFATRALIWVSRLFGGGGTALPGLWIEKYFPFLIKHYCNFYDEVIIITGTNGKTTTQLLIKHILTKHGLEVNSNTSGSNMFRGIAATVVSHGQPKSSKNALVLETEEGTMPKIAPYLTPTKVIVTNFFRDQLDAYGELHKTVEYVKTAILCWPSAKLFVNADDPHCQSLLKDIPNEKQTFSMGKYKSDFMYEGKMLVENKKPDIICYECNVNDAYQTTVAFSFGESTGNTDPFQVDTPLIGQYNVYNLMAAILLSKGVGITPSMFKQYLSGFKTPFGRGEQIIINTGGNSTQIKIFLIKNPAGMTQVWNMVKDRFADADCIIALNDNIADGRDVSWIWDAKIEIGKVQPQKLFLTGTRAYDIAIRMKYAGYNINENYIVESIQDLIQILKNETGKKYIILATYTAMNSIRSKLAKHTKIEKFS